MLGWWTSWTSDRIFLCPSIAPQVSDLGWHLEVRHLCLKTLWCVWQHVALSEWSVSLKRWREVACPAINATHHGRERFPRQETVEIQFLTKINSSFHISSISQEEFFLFLSSFVFPFCKEISGDFKPILRPPRDFIPKNHSHCKFLWTCLDFLFLFDSFLFCPNFLSIYNLVKP